MANYENKGFRFLPARLIIFTLDLFDRLSRVFVRLKIHPNWLSLAGLISGLVVGICYATHQPFLALVFLAFCGMLDILDGKVATNGNKKTLFGAVFDSSLDRHSEFAIYLGLGFYYKTHWILWVLALAFLGSTMVSYTRARAESLGVDCRVGMMQRAERIVILLLGNFIGLVFNCFNQAMIVSVVFIALGANITAIQRLAYVYNYERRKKNNPGNLG
ncbi:MAG: CDP-alcohol phosphatidyltransferase family protein [Candidatus Aminicenantes bacterium]|nr:CDP-alcohol phosphatidyltransferase family protein [Candidatus Aminicenantes bacterium]